MILLVLVGALCVLFALALTVAIAGGRRPATRWVWALWAVGAGCLGLARMLT